jgi:hypothetical protein
MRWPDDDAGLSTATLKMAVAAIMMMMMVIMM